MEEVVHRDMSSRADPRVISAAPVPALAYHATDSRMVLSLRGATGRWPLVKPGRRRRVGDSERGHSSRERGRRPWTIVKVRDGLSRGDYSDPAWYAHAKGTVSYLLDGRRLDQDASGGPVGP